jgi:hypothetical protein
MTPEETHHETQKFTGRAAGITIIALLVLLIGLTLFNQLRDWQVDGTSIEDRKEIHRQLETLGDRVRRLEQGK